MSCFSNRTKHRCAKFVMIVSIVLIVLGLASGLFGYLGIDIEETWEIGDTELPSPMAVFGILAILAGLFSVVTGLFGLLAAKFKKCCFTMPFMILTVIMSILMLIVALLAIIGQGQQDAVFDYMCKGEGQPAMKVTGETYANLQEYASVMYGGSVDRFMCTGLCPCDEAHKQLFQEATKDGFEITPGQKRVYDISQLTPEQKKELEGPTPDVRLWDLSADVVPLYFKAKDVDTFDNFMKCYTTVLEKHFKGDSDAKYQKIDYAIKFFDKLEKDLDCSGACSLPLFGVERAIADGPATTDCVKVILDSLEDLLAPGIVCLLTFFVLMCACFGSFPICTGFDKTDDLEEG